MTKHSNRGRTWRKVQTGTTPAVKIVGKRQVVKTPNGPCRDKDTGR